MIATYILSPAFFTPVMEHLLKLRLLGVFAFWYMKFITLTFNHFRISTPFFLMLLDWHQSKGTLCNLAYKWSTEKSDESESLSTQLIWADALLTSEGVHPFLKCLIRSIKNIKCWPFVHCFLIRVLEDRRLVCDYQVTFMSF